METNVLPRSGTASPWERSAANTALLWPLLLRAWASKTDDHGGLDRHVGGFEKAIREAIPHARICFDSFHVVQVAQRAVDSVRREEWNRHESSATPHGRWFKGTRWALVKAPENRTESQDELLAHVQRTNARLYRAYLLKEQLRAIYGREVAEGASHPKARGEPLLRGLPGIEASLDPPITP